MKNLDEVNGAAVDYLMFAGYTTVAYFWAVSAVAAQRCLKEGGKQEKGFYEAKLATAEFYYQRIMPRVLAHEAAIKNGVDSMMELDESQFAYL